MAQLIVSCKVLACHIEYVNITVIYTLNNVVHSRTRPNIIVTDRYKYTSNLRSLFGCSDRCVMYAGLLLVVDHDSLLFSLPYAHMEVNSRRYVRARMCNR